MTARPHPRVTLADGRYAHERHVERARQPETPSVRFVDDVEPTDRREAKRGMIRAMLCMVVGMYLFAVIVS